MCRGSVYADRSEDAKPDVAYQIGSTNHHGGNHRHGVLFGDNGVYLAGNGVASRRITCAACIREPTAVTLTNVPVVLQERFGIGESTPAVFISGDDEPDRQDKLELPDGQKVYLYDFADQGIRLALQPIDARKVVEEPVAAARELEVV